MLEQIKSLVTEEHQYKTVVLDTTDAAAKLGEAYVCEQNGWSSAADPKAGYGAFYVAEENAWVHLLSGLNVLHTQKGMSTHDWLPFEEAREFKLSGSRRVQCDLDEMRECLADGCPIIFGLKLTAPL